MNRVHLPLHLLIKNNAMIYVPDGWEGPCNI